MGCGPSSTLVGDTSAFLYSLDDLWTIATAFNSKMIHKLPLVLGVTWLSLTGTLAERNCDNRLCLTSFRWCDSSPCDFPENVLPIQSDLDDSNTGYGVLHGTGEYNITWINADADHPISIEWRFLVGEVEPDYGAETLSWGVSK